MSNNTNVQVFLACITRNEDGVYERIGDDQVYEQLDEPDLLVARESAADTSSTTYEDTATMAIVTGTCIPNTQCTCIIASLNIIRKKYIKYIRKCCWHKYNINCSWYNIFYLHYSVG